MTLQRVALAMVSGNTGIGAERSLLEKLSDRVSVKDFGAKGDGTTDDTAAIQAAFDWALENGAEVEFPAGRYRITSTVTVDHTEVPGENERRVSIRGAGAACTVLASEVGENEYCLFFNGSDSADNSLTAFQSIQGLRLEGPPGVGIGIGGTNLPYFAGRDLTIIGFADSIYCTDILSSLFENVIMRGALRGATFVRLEGSSYVSDPNNITFLGCTLASMPAYGLRLIGGSCLNFIGGSIEGIGRPDEWQTSYGSRPSERWGVKLENMGREGGVGCNFVGTYIEGNDVLSDVWIVQQDGDPFITGVAYNFSGVNFHRSAPIVAGSPIYSINNIKVETGVTKPLALHVSGCGFRGASSYTPSSDRPCIQLPPAGRGWKAVQSGNFFSAPNVDAPAWTTTPAFTARLVSDQTILSDTQTVVGFEALENYGNAFDNDSHKFIAPHECRMQFNMQVQVNGIASADSIKVEVRVNGNLTRMKAVSAPNAAAQYLNLSWMLALQKYDEVRVEILTYTPSGSRTLYSALSSTYWEGHAV